MPLPNDLKQYYSIIASLSLALCLIATPVDAPWAKSNTNKADAQTVKQKAKSKPKPKAKAKPTKLRHAKAKPTPPVPAVADPAKELEIIEAEANTLHNALGLDPADTMTRQKLAVLALRAARAAERALSRGDDGLFNAYREQIRTRFGNTRPELESMSKRGIGAAEYALGAIALHGILEDADIERACIHFAAAIDKGFGGAKFRHGQCIEQRDPARAYALLIEAADSGHVGANERLGRLCLDAKPPDASCAFARLERAAKEGRASAKTLLGWMHAEGVGGRVDIARATEYYLDAAKQGEPAARNNLGELLETGRGVPKDESAALENYLAAAKNGFPPAQFNAGRLYAAGRGTAQNLDEARRWLGEAEKAGITPAREILDMLDREAAR